MWDLYLRGGPGVAIATTLSGIEGALGATEIGRLHFGLVRYVDFDTHLQFPLNPLVPFYLKRAEYSQDRGV